MDPKAAPADLAKSTRNGSAKVASGTFEETALRKSGSQGLDGRVLRQIQYLVGRVPWHRRANMVPAKSARRGEGNDEAGAKGAPARTER